MLKQTVRHVALVLTLAGLFGTSQIATAQSTSPTVVSGGDPQPTGEKPHAVLIILSMFLALS